MCFWRALGSNNPTPIPLSLTLDPAVFTQRIHDLAEQIRNQLMALRQAPQPAIHPPSATGTAAVQLSVQQQRKYRPVLLAQVTDDLDEERDQVRRYLGQFGVTVLPDETYPQGGEAFKAAFTADLARAGLFVQLLSRQAGRAPPDLREGYTQFQHQAAAAAGIDIVQWRRPDCDPASVANLAHRELLAGETVIATGLEALKAEVLRLTALPLPGSAAPKASRSSLVFIDADRDDRDIAKALQAEFSRHKFPVAIAALDGPAEEVRADLEDNIVECDALVVVYGQTTPVWVRAQLRLYNKLKARRSEPPRVLALYTGPPTEKPDVGFALPEVREIDCRAALTFDQVRALINELEA